MLGNLPEWFLWLALGGVFCVGGLLGGYAERDTWHQRAGQFRPVVIRGRTYFLREWKPGETP